VKHAHENDEIYKLRNAPVVEAYMVLFAIQCLLLMMNGLNLFRTHPYFGIFLRILSLMIRDMSHFAFLLGSVCVGFYFAVYIIVGTDLIQVMTVTNSGPYNRFELIRGVALFMYQVLLGQQSWSDLYIDSSTHFSSGRSEMVTIFVSIFGIIGVILLLNLLIAVLTTSFSDVSDIANEEAAFTQTHRTYLLIYKTKTLPPPFNIIVYCVFLVIIVLHYAFSWGLDCCKISNLFSWTYGLNPLAYALFNQQYASTKGRDTSSGNHGPKKYCPFCYYEYNNKDKLTIDNFLDSSTIKQQQIDPSDRQYVKRASLYSNCYFCCQCYRPFQHMHELLNIQEVILDFISFYIWLIAVMPFMTLLTIGPAVTIRIANWFANNAMENMESHYHGVRRFHLHEDELIVEDVPTELAPFGEKDD